MDIIRFLDLVLPDEGLRVAAILSPEWEGMRHKFLTDNQSLAALTLQSDREPRQVYLACNSYLDRAGGRKGDNVAACRSFYLDLDAGPGKPYATAQEALGALKAFLVATGLPTPLLVSSGHGIHCWWPMDADLRPGQWHNVALVLKEACKRQGLVADPSRTADRASVLRAPDTTHRKGSPAPVKVLRWCEQIPLATFQGALEAYVGIEVEADDLLGARPAYLGGPVDNSDLGTKADRPPAYADRVADKCLVMGMMRETRGVTDQPTWYHALQVLNRCEDGKEFAHEWSKGDSRYTTHEVDSTLARLADIGPTLCSKFEDYQPALCAACPNRGKVSSPILLGEAPSVPAVITTTPSFSMGFASSAEREQEITVNLPFRFQWRQPHEGSPRHALCFVTDKEEGEEPDIIQVSNTLFYPVERMDDDHKGASVEIEVRQRLNRRKRFTLATSTIAKGGDALSSELGKHEILANPGRNPLLQAYLVGWVDQMKEERDAVQIRNHYGWFDRSFLAGSTLIQPGGLTSPSILGSWAARSEKALQPVGDLPEWVRLVDAAYNAPGQEAYQFMVLCSFAAPLFQMLDGVDGITVYAHSDGTGVGKTTAQRVGLSAWGNWRDLQLADEKITDNMLWAVIGAMSNLPVVIDEMTNQTNSQASKVIYSISSGRAKQRMTSSAEPRDNNSNWSTIVMASGNSLISEKLTQGRGNAAAELARLFEFTVDAPTYLTPSEAGKLFPRLLENYGVAGPTMMRYVVDNYDTVKSMLASVLDAFNTEMGIESGERYWAALFASVLTAQLICRKLKLISFPVAPMRDWINAQLANNRHGRDANVPDPLALFGRMMGDLYQGILVTEGMGDRRTGNIATIPKDGRWPMGQLTGRAIIPVLQTEKHLLALSVSAVKQWCNKNNVSSSTMFSTLVREGWAAPDVRKFVLGQGTLQYASVTSSVHCWILDPVQMGVDLSLPSNITQLVTPRSKNLVPATP